MYRYKLYITVMYAVMIQTSLGLISLDHLTRKKKNEVRSQKVKLRPHSLQFTLS